jgi:hypothetical protein
MIPMGKVTIVLGGLAAAAAAISIQAATPRTTATPGPRLVPVAETRLLMEGLAQPNFRGLEKLLKDKPEDAEAWTFARGQALLIAETGNLLMLRPPRNPAERLWMDRATDLRTAAAQLAGHLGNRDYDKSRKGLAALAERCNACHQSFRIKTRIVPFAEPAEKE